MKTYWDSRIRWATMVILAGAAIAGGITWAQSPATAPSPMAGTTTAPSTMPAGGPALRVWLVDDLNDLSDKIEKVFPQSDWADAEKRAKAAPEAIVLFHRVEADLDKLAPLTDEPPDQVAVGHIQIDALLYALNDPDTLAQLKQASTGPAPAALNAKLSMALGQWFEAGADAAQQEKVLQSVHDLAKSDPSSEPVGMVVVLVHESSNVTPAVKTEAEKIITTELTSPLAKQVSQEIANEAKLRALEGKPLVIKGTTVDGTAFTTADWKGSVILVDFWATWCGPCMAELPRVTKAYATYHPKGLQVLGVSNDYAQADLTKFLAANKDVAWPQLFDKDAAAKHAWNPITEGYGIDGIPTMFLIDKKGVVRTVEARANFEDLIPKMLDEPAQ